MRSCERVVFDFAVNITVNRYGTPLLALEEYRKNHSMPPTAPQHAIVISSENKLMTVPLANSGAVQSDNIPKYAIGLFDTNKNGPRKRKRLTHLTPEEKIMRR